MTHAHIDSLERIPLGDGLVYRPIRRPLGITAFGANAYTADRAGEVVIEFHDEVGGGSAEHEELYVVVAGRAEFTVADERIDAPPGMLVLVAPGTRRGAVARADGTTVLVIGAAPGAAGPVSVFEYWYAAKPAYDAGDYARAYEIASAGLADHPDHGTLHYQLACYAALDGRLDVARAHLDQAFAGDPRTREWAATDEDLAALRT
jgi:mannose-6-phosphate isomerase-like protein (cupin superfamily)